MRILLLIGLALFAFKTYAQSNQSLLNYKLPDLERRALDFSLDGWGFLQPEESAVITNSTSFSNFTGYVSRSYYQITRRIQRESSTSLRINMRNSKNVGQLNPLFKSVIREQRISLSNRSAKRLYNNSNYFTLIGTFIAADLSQSKFDITTPAVDTESKTVTRNVFGHVEIGRGIGRLEAIQDMRHALFLIDRLTRVGRFEEVSDEQKEVIASRVSELKNMRFYDFRLQRIYEIEAIDSLFQSLGLVPVADARYFSILGDTWDYGNDPVRFSGRRYTVSLLPNLNYMYGEDGSPPIGTPSLYDLTGFAIRSRFQFINDKPLNENWQHTYYADASINLRVDDNFLPDQIFFEHGQSFGFFPDTRTNVTLGYILNYSKFYDGSFFAGLESGFAASLELSSYYYVTPKLRFQGNITPTLSISGNAPSFSFQNFGYSDANLFSPVQNFDSVSGLSFILAMTYSLF